MNNSKYSADSAFLDVLLNLVCGLTALFVLSFLLISIENKKSQNLESKAEFVITVEWDKDSEYDVDSYCEDPLGNLVAFMRREQGLMSLNRDDTGFGGDRINTPNGTYEYKINREQVQIRGIIPGEYTFNVHLYSNRGNSDPIKVYVKLEKMNPYSIQAAKEVELNHVGHEITVFRFTVNEDGNIENVNNLQKKLATDDTGRRL